MPLGCFSNNLFGLISHEIDAFFPKIILIHLLYEEMFSSVMYFSIRL
jgi:hypothetical protein